MRSNTITFTAVSLAGTRYLGPAVILAVIAITPEMYASTLDIVVNIISSEDYGTTLWDLNDLRRMLELLLQLKTRTSIMVQIAHQMTRIDYPYQQINLDV